MEDTDQKSDLEEEASVCEHILTKRLECGNGFCLINIPRAACFRFGEKLDCSICIRPFVRNTDFSAVAVTSIRQKKLFPVFELKPLVLQKE